MFFLSDLSKRKTIDVFARQLVDVFVKRLPLSREREGKRFSREFEIIFSLVQGFHRKENLGVFGKSRLLNQLRWGLIDRGYSSDFSEVVVKDMAVRLTKKL